MIRFFNLFLLTLFLGAWPAFGFKAPMLTSPVIDQAGLLSPGFARSLAQDLSLYKSQKGVQIQVLIVGSLADEPIESVAIQVFDQWKLGDEKADDGILFLIAPNEKKLRIEVGQGLEGLVPDVYAKKIVSDIVSPYFKQGQFDQGVRQGVGALVQVFEKGLKEGELKGPHKKSKLQGGWVFLLLLGLWLLIFMISPATALHILFAVMSGGRGGGGGGGGWSGGGGRSSGGGASGDW